ncbi:hypothetical protein JCGZ_24148 [Jatropha curcas]|uniref:Uncharacterized protein n=1 Tax=Jatropha curcas TaxID=180498 RepID=A0A067K1Q8_JATCU|nr:hypothetical protein JCGZ_24148 [Jatropha curcas]
MRCATQDRFRGAPLRRLQWINKYDTSVDPISEVLQFRRLSFRCVETSFPSNSLCFFLQPKLIAAENVIDWLSGNAMIDPVTCPVSHGMKLWEFIPDAETAIGLWHDLPSLLCWGTIEFSRRAGEASGTKKLESLSATAVAAALNGGGSRRGQRLRSPVNTQILRLKEPVFSDCKQSGWAGGHSESSPEVCQYGT